MSELESTLWIGFGVTAAALIFWWLAGRYEKPAGDISDAQPGAQTPRYAVPGVERAAEKSHGFIQKMGRALHDTGILPYW